MKEIFIILAQVFQLAIPILFAITIHEVSHGWVALKLGDATAQLQGRLTINPIKHIDPIGTVLVPALLFYFGGFIFGWAKPVPITWENLKKPQRDMALVAIAGPFTNLIMALLWAIFAKICLLVSGDTIHPATLFLLGMAKVGILINIILMVLNLLPVPPLDGSRVLFSFLPANFVQAVAKYELFGFVILVILLATGVLTKIIFPIIAYLFNLIVHLIVL